MSAATEATDVPPDVRRCAADPDVLYDEICDRGRLTRRQLLVWAGDRLAQGAPVFVEAVLLHLRGPLDAHRFVRAFDATVRRADALTSAFAEVDGWPHLVDVGSAAIEVVDLTRSAAPERTLEDLARERIWSCGGRGGPLADALLVRLAPERHGWVVVQHQLISDSWSFGVLYDRLLAHYCVPTGALAVSASPQFAEYRSYERRLRASADAAAARAYWRRSYAGGIERAERAAGRDGTRVCRVVHRLGPDRTAALRAFAGGAATPPDLATFVAFASMAVAHVHRTTGSRDVVLDVPFANRPSARFKNTFGSFMNVCPVRVGVEGADRVRWLRDRILEATWEAARYQGYAGRGGAVPQPYDVLVNVHRSAVVAPSFDACATKVEWLVPTHRFGAVAIAVHDFGATGEMSLVVDFNEATFGAASRADFVASLVSTLDAQLADPDQRVGDADRRVGNADRPARAESRRAPVSAATVWSRFMEQAARTPGAVAVCAREACITYETVRVRACAIAALLAAHGVEREAIVTVVGPRTPDWVAAMLGVWAHGGVYLPIDRRWPAARIERIMSQSRSGLILAVDDAPDAIRTLSGRARWAMLSIRGESLTGCLQGSGRCDATAVASTDVAYVVYTSGSTGFPKGAQIEHAGFANHLDAKIALLGLDARDRVAQTAASSFDVSLWQTLAPLLVGGATEILDDETVRDPAALRAALIDREITIVELVPALLDLLLAVDEGDAPRLGGLRWVISTGEALMPELCRRWLRRYPAIPIVNAYGPTECSDDVTHHVVRTPPPRGMVRVPIGRPIPNVTVDVLDEALRAVPAGEVGEICVGGLAVGRGYLEDGVRTAGAFVVPDPFAGGGAARLYRTGDLGRWLPDATLEWRGRRDAQVKIRGVRLELEEIEAVLCEHSSVAQAAVHVEQPDPAPTTKLTACIVLRDPDRREEELRMFLEARLPVEMVPSRFVVLEALSLTANGKIDREALAAAVRARVATAPVAPLENEIERSLATIWTRLLGVDGIGRGDDFFGLGGDSLLVHRMLLEVYAAFAIAPSSEAFLGRPTIAALAAAIGATPAGISEDALESVLGDVEALSDEEVATLLDRDRASGATAERDHA